MNQKISIGIRVGDRCTEVGKVGEHIWIEVDPLGLSILGKKGLVEIDPVYSGSRKIGNYFRTSQDWGITRDLTNLAISKHEIGADSVYLSSRDLENMLAQIDHAGEIEEQQKKERLEKERIVAQEAQEKEEKRKQEIATARAVLADDLQALNTEIARLKKENNDYYQKLKKTQDEIKTALIDEMINEGTIEREEEKTVTYKIVREDEE